VGTEVAAVPSRASRRAAIRLRPAAFSREARCVWFGVVAFIAMSVWWLTQDDRVPDFDSGLHMTYAFLAHAQIATGKPTAPFTDWNTYPPLVHLLGAATIGLVGMHPMALILSSNLVFVPLLAFGCFGVGKMVAGPRAGLLAAVFALGAPMFVSMMHEYQLDTAQAAMVAVSVWAVLASRRFDRAGIALLGGVLTGLALMTKETSVVFLAGLVAAVVVRGGWRHPLGLAAFAVGALAIAGWWYVYHWSDVTNALGTVGGAAPSSLQAPPRWTARNWSWYFWDLSNQQIFAPFLLALGIGTAAAIRDSVRRRSPENVLPELLAGGLFSYVGMTWLVHKDPRYTLPALVYVAVLATWWIARISRPRLRITLTAAVVALAIFDFAGISTGFGGPVVLRLPGSQESIIRQHEFVLYKSDGWVRGGPVHDGAALSLMHGLRHLGIRDVEYTGAEALDFNSSGLNALAETAGLLLGPAPINAPYNAFIVRRAVHPGDPPPCQRLLDETGIYIVRGFVGGLNMETLTNSGNSIQPYALICPGRPEQIIPKAAAPPA
jgi:Dolichyl-phosphate-mannose-protein mannosyltransferase